MAVQGIIVEHTKTYDMPDSMYPSRSGRREKYPIGGHADVLPEGRGGGRSQVQWLRKNDTQLPLGLDHAERAMHASMA